MSRESADDMKALLRFVLVVTGVVLLGFAVHDMVSFGMGVSSSVSHAPRELWYVLVDVVTWGIHYKEMAIVAFVVCFLALYISRAPSIDIK